MTAHSVAGADARPVPEDELARELRHTWLTASSPEYIGSADEFLAMWGTVADHVRKLLAARYEQGYAQGCAAGRGYVMLGDADLDAMVVERVHVEFPVTGETQTKFGEEP